MSWMALASLVLALLGEGAAAQAPAEMPGSEIVNYHRVRPDLAIAGAPTPATVLRLKDLGFRTVIDLRMPAEGTADEKAAVEAAGLKYASIPFTPASFSRADAEAVRKAIAAPDAGGVLLHCATANRAGGLFAVLRRLEGADLEEAIADGRKAGLHSESMLEAVRRVASEAAEPKASAPDERP